MPVKAPFRFARINRWIHEPAWAPLVSHDVPFADGLSGHATLRITAKTPLLVGGRRRQATESLEGAVWPFRLPDGRWALPPSSLQGLTRSILEVAAFGRLGPWIEDRRFGIRDLTDSATARKHYREFLPNTRVGWLIKRDGQPAILECKMARLSHEELHNKTRVNFSNEKVSLEEKYEAIEHWVSTSGGEVNFSLRPGKVHMHATPAAKGIPGSVVITGHVAKKKREFVFHDPAARSVPTSSASVVEVPDTVWKTFEYLHCDSNGQPTHPAWAYWMPRFHEGKPVPVFWWPETGNPKKVATFGMAFAFKAGFPLSTYDLLRHSHPGHLTDPSEAALDLPHLIFGIAAAEGDQALKRRAWFGLAKSAEGDVQLKTFNSPAILSSPKPKYLGLYVRQRQSPSATIPQGKGGEPMAAYAALKLTKNQVVGPDSATALDNLSRPELAGVKLWPSSADRERDVVIPAPDRMRPNDPTPGPKVKTELSAVPAGTVFEAPLTFHNLRPVELGALLWALSFGNPKAFGAQNKDARLRHRLGMGKPFGLGEVEIQIEGLTVNEAATTPTNLIFAFTDHMETAYPKLGAWVKSPQVRALLRAANPSENRTEDLVYMKMIGSDSYVENRDRGGFLGPYVNEEDEIVKQSPSAGEASVANRPIGSNAATSRSSGPIDPIGRGGAMLGQQLRFRKGTKVSIHGEVGTLLEDVTEAVKPGDRVRVDFGGDEDLVGIKDIVILD